MSEQIPTPKEFVSKEIEKVLVRVTQKIMLDTFACQVTHRETVFTELVFPAADISGFVSITQESMNGTLAFLFPKVTLTGLLTTIYRTPPANPEKSMAAAVGEICNMVFGAMKTELNSGQRGYMIKMALPNVVVGHQHQVLTFLQGHKFIATFDTGFGPFQMGVTSSNG